MHSRTPTAALAVVLALAFSPIPATHAAGETCHGEPATLVGTPGMTAQGTDAADTIVSNGAAAVYAGSGDDLVCITGDTDHVQVHGDDGDDTIDGTAVTQGVEVFGGQGADTMTTGPGPDSVVASETGTRATDHISTGDGDDYIQLGTDPAPDPDIVDAGPGDDRIRADGTGWTADGGTGTNSLVSFDTGPGTDGDDWVVDVELGVATRNGQQAFNFAHFSHFGLSLGMGTGSHLVFRGTDADESFRLLDSFSGHTEVELGGGDDLADMDPRGHVQISGGPGEDKVRVHGNGGDLDADLATGSLVVDAEDGTTEHTVTGFERFQVGRFDDAVIRGSGGDDWITASWAQCVTLRGRGGDDVLRATFWYRSSCRVRFVGGAGDDRMFGRDTDDVLVGGTGVDRADGGSGRDRCGAEARFNCEDDWPAE